MHSSIPLSHQPVITLDKVSLSYQSERGEPLHVLEEISVELFPGELVAILGPSGCGKSSLLSIIPGLSKPDGGRVVVRDSPATGSALSIGMVFQDPVLFAWRTAFENVMLPLEILVENGSDITTEQERGLRVNAALSRVGLAGFEDSLPHELSGGMKARVAVARALVTDPAVIIMDEPFASVDDISRSALNLRLLEIKRDTEAAMVFVTHSIGEAVLLADRVLMLSRRPARVILDIPISFGSIPRNEELSETPEFSQYVRQLRLALKEAAL